MRRYGNFLAAGILLLGLFLTALGWYFASVMVKRDTQNNFDYRMAQATQTLNHRLASYTEVLKGLQGYFYGSEKVDRAEFRLYLSRLDLQRRYPGFWVIGYAPRVAPGALPLLVETVRRDKAIDPNGYPHFSVHPGGERAEHFPIIYVDPMAGNEKAFGFDFSGEIERYAALQRARDSGLPAATGSITLVQDDAGRAGFLIMLPLYRSGVLTLTVEQRRAAFLGVVYAAFVVDDLMRGVFISELMQQNRLAIFDIGLANSGISGERKKIFDSFDLSEKFELDPRWTIEKRLEVGGRQWLLEYRAGRKNADFGEIFPLLVLFAGLSVSLLTFGVMRALVSARSRAQSMAENMTQELRASETRTRTILNSVLDGIITINERGVIETFSPSAGKIFGYEAQEVIGENINMLMPEPYHSAHDSYLNNYLSTGLRKVIGIGREVSGRRKDGSVFPMDLAVTEMIQNGQRMFTGIVRDITERKRGEAALLETMTLQHAILNSANYSIISTDHAGTILTFNAAAEHMLGYRAEEVVGKLTPAILHDPQEVVKRAQTLSHELGREIKPGFEVFVAKAILGNTDENEWSYIRKDGSHFPVMLSVTALRDRDGKISGFLGIGQDITERKQIERMKNEFVSTVSHELRTPLTSIRGSLGLIAGGVAGEIPAQARMLVDIAHNNAERLVRLINDILDVEKIESGKLEFHNRNLDLMPLVEQALSDNQAYGAQLGVSFTLTQSAREAWVYGDSDRLLQVMANLLSNAAKFSPRGATVSVAATQPQPGWVRVAVQDHGPGIPPEFHARIFEKFAQADSSDTRQKGGTGLGLSITRALVEKMNGFIGFDSTPGVGTTFYFELPLQRQQALDVMPTSVSTRPRVLVCEDDQDIANLLCLMLEGGGFACEVVHDAAQAKKLLHTTRFDAMTLDLSLPGQDGISLVRELREQEATRQLPIVVVSARAREGQLELEGASFAVSDWISKPIEPDRLLAALQSATHASLDELPTILHVEDDADILQVVATLLSGQALVVPAHNLAEAREKLDRQHFDLVILDISLPDGSGLDLLPLLSASMPAMPALIFSAQEVESGMAHEITSALVKSRTSNEKLLETIRTLAQPQN